MRKQEMAFVVILGVTILGVWQYEKYEERKRAENSAKMEQQSAAQSGKDAATK